MKYIFLIILIAFSSSRELMAGESQHSQFGFVFLKITPDARSYSLGNTVAIGNLWNSGYWNPAGIGITKDAGFQYDHLDYFAGISSQNWTAGYNHHKWGSIAFTYNRFSYGTLEKTTEEFPEGGIGSYKPYEDVMAITYAFTFFDKISCGATIKRVHSKIDLISASGLLYDIGVMGKFNIGQIASTSHTAYAGASAGNNILGKKPHYEGSGIIKPVNVGTDTAFLVYGIEPFNVERNYRAGIGYGIEFKDRGVMNGNVKVIELIGHLSYQDFSSTNIFVSDHSYKSNRDELIIGTEINFLEIASLRFATETVTSSGGFQQGDRFGFSIQLPSRLFIKSKFEITPKYEYSEQDKDVLGDRVSRWSFGLDVKL